MLRPAWQTAPDWNPYSMRLQDLTTLTNKLNTSLDCSVYTIALNATRYITFTIHNYTFGYRTPALIMYCDQNNHFAISLLYFRYTDTGVYAIEYKNIIEDGDFKIVSTSFEQDETTGKWNVSLELGASSGWGYAMLLSRKLVYYRQLE